MDKIIIRVNLTTNGSFKSLRHNRNTWNGNLQETPPWDELKKHKIIVKKTSTYHPACNAHEFRHNDTMLTNKEKFRNASVSR